VSPRLEVETRSTCSFPARGGQITRRKSQ